jgi:hypothetical protein
LTPLRFSWLGETRRARARGIADVTAGPQGVMNVAASMLSDVKERE